MNWLYRLFHRVGFHNWLAYPDGISGQHCPRCGARRESVDVDDSPWGVRSRSTQWIITARAWEKEVSDVLR